MTSTQNEDNNHCIDQSLADTITEETSKSSSKTSEASESFDSNVQQTSSTDLTVLLNFKLDFVTTIK